MTGPANATRAVVDIYDVFGLASQTLQGADRLSQHIGDCLVFVSDLLDGNYVKPDWLPPDSKHYSCRSTVSHLSYLGFHHTSDTFGLHIT